VFSLAFDITSSYWTPTLNTSVLDFCFTVYHQLGKVIQMNQLDATMIY